MCGGTFANKPGKGCSRVTLEPISVIGSDTDEPGSTAESDLQYTVNKYPAETANEKTQYIRLTTNCDFTKPKFMAQPIIDFTNLTDAEKQTLQNAIIDRQKNIEAIEKEIARTR